MQLLDMRQVRLPASGDGYSVNVRCLDPSTIERIEIKPFNGLEWEKQDPEARGKLPDD